MFGMGMPEILLIMAIALIVIGPKKLPDLAKSMGKAFGEFKRATQDLKQAIDVDSDLKTVKRTFDDVDLDKLADTVKPPPAADADPSGASGADHADPPPAADAEDTAPPDDGTPRSTADKNAGTDGNA